MTLGDFIEESNLKLSALYDNREKKNILDIIVEEEFGLKKHEIKGSQDATLSPSKLKHLHAIVSRLQQQEPIQYVLGVADFYGLKFKLDKHVLIPRPETEELVDFVIQDCKKISNPGPTILDIGTGSGCIPVTIKKYIPGAQVVATDLSKEALVIAQDNAGRNEVEVDFVHADFLDESSWENFDKMDIVISNPPYVTKDEFDNLHPRVKQFEPTQALKAENDDPFIFYKKIADFGFDHLNDNGHIYVELNSNRSQVISDIFRNRGYQSIQLKQDLQGLDRILKVGK